MKNFVKNHKGFTIVELVIVIAVIAVLAGVLIPTFSGIVAKANRSRALQEATNAYKNLTYNSVSGESALIRDGYLFTSGDYAFTNIDGKLYELEKLGEANNSADVDSAYFFLGSYTVRGTNPTDAVFYLNNSYGASYAVYSLKHPTENGYYYLFCNVSVQNNSQYVGAGIYAPACLYAANPLTLSDFALSSVGHHAPIVALSLPENKGQASEKVAVSDDLSAITVNNDFDADSYSFNGTEVSIESGEVTIAASYLKSLLGNDAGRAEDKNWILFQ